MLWLIALVLVLLVYLLYTKVSKIQSHWSDRGVKCTKSWPPFGDFTSCIFRRISMPDKILQLYKLYPQERYFGINEFMTPMLLLKDLELIKKIGITDFDHFQDHRHFVNKDVDVLIGNSLIALKGQEWKNTRATVSPAFTSAKMKSMFILMSECAEQFVEHFLTQGKDTISLEMKDIFTRFANDIIASTAFGVQCDSLKEKDNEIYTMGKEGAALSLVGFVLMAISPALAKYFKKTLIPQKPANFFRRIVKESIENREKHGIVRPDMITLLIEARKGKLKHETNPEDDDDAGFATVKESSIGTQEVKLQKELTDDELTAQVLMFFLGGFDTTSSTMCFLAFELALNPDIQTRLQKEVDETREKCNGKLTYDALLKMKYMDMVLSETLRKWPLGIMTDRACVKPYTIEPRKSYEKPLHLDVGQIIMFPWYGLHRDPQYYPDPDKFDPERFSDENKSFIVTGSYMPFGIGPRNCIGSRFALLEIKTLFFHLLAKFDISVIEKTEIPLKLSKKPMQLMAENGFWLGFKPRNTNDGV